MVKGVISLLAATQPVVWKSNKELCIIHADTECLTASTLTPGITCQQIHTEVPHAGMTISCSINIIKW